LLFPPFAVEIHNILVMMLVLVSGCCPLRGDLLVRWPRQAEDEIFEVFEKENEHQAQ